MSANPQAAVTRPLRRVSFTDLFHEAALAFGDPTQWYRIASANALTDPWISGNATLQIPQTIATSNGGILYPAPPH